MKRGGESRFRIGQTVVHAKFGEGVIVNLEGGGMSIKMLGIFKLEGDTLKICLAFMGDRPTKLESPDGSLTVLLTLKRTKKE